MRWLGANLEEKQEPRGASVAEAQNGDSMKSSGRSLTLAAIEKRLIYYRPLRSPCPRADAARVGIQRDVPVKIRWHLVMLGSDRLKRADTGPDTTIRMRSENRDFRQLHCLETVSPRRAGELRDRGLHEPVSAGPHWIRICGKHASRQKMLHPGSRTYQ
jgi:hypothetical protein